MYAKWIFRMKFEQERIEAKHTPLPGTRSANYVDKGFIYV